MKPFAVHDPSPTRNEYLTKVYLASLRLHSQLTEIADLDDAKDCILLVNGDYLNPERILRLKNNGVFLVAFDINDNTLLSDAYRYSEEISLVDLIFKIGGVQNQNSSQDLSVDQDFNFSLVPRLFLADDLWIRYKALSDASRLQSLPYVPWGRLDAPQRSYAQRSGHVLVRGGNHFYRFLVFLNLLKIGRADKRCSFANADYFRRDMNPQFRHCENCISEREHGRARFQKSYSSAGCTSPAEWGGEVVGLDRYETANKWNNRCPRSFFWLTEQFEKRHGSIDRGAVEIALNGSFEPDHEFLNSLSQATFYTDLKWLFSIYAPPRFWESAKSSAINFLPRRTNEQSYFPEISDGVHYLTFLEDFSDFNPAASEQVWSEITANCMELYNGWIRQGARPISERLCRHIFTQIEIAVERSVN